MTIAKLEVIVAHMKLNLVTNIMEALPNQNIASVIC